MTELAILSDTHIPSRATQLPAWVAKEIGAADIVIHAGDFDSKDALVAIDELATTLVAVAGNADPPLDLPRVAHLEVDGVAFVVTHGDGGPAGYHRRVLETVRSTDADAIGISGHTHQLGDVTIEGTRLLNPGSATGVPPAARATILRATTFDGTVTVTTREEP